MNLAIRITKRLMDIILGGACLTLSLPLFAGIALAVKSTSRGPVFYKQQRAGMIPAAENKIAPLFWVYKFRTMDVHAERQGEARLAERGDPRVTSVGRFLRMTRLDELPQFINVLKGEMSIVGPRPERPELLEALSAAIPFFEERMRLVKPGITGLAQIELSYTGGLQGESELEKLADTLLNPYDLVELKGSVADDMRLKMLFDMAYSARLEGFKSFIKTDLSIMCKTPIVMFIKRTGQ